MVSALLPLQCGVPVGELQHDPASVCFIVQLKSGTFLPRGDEEVEVTRNWRRCLAFRQEVAGIQSLIENESTDQWVRGAALGSLVTLVATGQKSRDEIVSYFADLFRGKLVRKWSHVWDALVCHSSDLYPEELLDDIKKAYQEGLVDPDCIRFDNVKHDLAMGKDRILARLADNPHLRLVEDTVAEMGSWACFREDRRSTQPTRRQTPN